MNTFAVMLQYILYFANDVNIHVQEYGTITSLTNI